MCIHIWYGFTPAAWHPWFAQPQHVLCLQNVNSQVRTPTLRTPDKETKLVFGAPAPNIYIHSDPKTCKVYPGR